MKNKDIAYLAAGFFVGWTVLSFLGKTDHAHEVREHTMYCENVSDGVWPHFKDGDFANICPGYMQGTYKD